MKLIYTWCFFVFFFISLYVAGQNVGVNITGAVPDNSAILDIYSTTKGLLIPRMTKNQRDAITSPATGLLIYNLDCQILNYWDGTNWISMGGSAPAPTNVVVSGNICSGNNEKINVSWTASAGAISYNVTILGVSTGTTTATTYSTTFCPSCNTSYTVVVSANTICGTSGDSNSASFSVGVCGTCPCLATPPPFDPGAEMQFIGYYEQKRNRERAFMVMDENEKAFSPEVFNENFCRNGP